MIEDCSAWNRRVLAEAVANLKALIAEWEDNNWGGSIHLNLKMHESGRLAESATLNNRTLHVEKNGGR